VKKSKEKIAWPPGQGSKTSKQPPPKALHGCCWRTCGQVLNFEQRRKSSRWLADKEEAARSYQRLQTISSSTFTTNVDQAG